MLILLEEVVEPAVESEGSLIAELNWLEETREMMLSTQFRSQHRCNLFMTHSADHIRSSLELD